MRVLMSEASFGRLRGALDAHGRVLEPLLITADGTVLRQGREIDIAEIGAEVVWATFDLFGGPKGRAAFAPIVAAARPKWLQSSAAGFDNPLFRQIVESGALLTISHSMAIGVAEYVLANVLDCFQMAHARRAAQTERAWRRVPFREVQGTNWLLIGFGAIGQEIAQRARAFGARIVGVRRTQDRHPLADRIAARTDLPTLLPEADVVVMCIPHRRETRRLADAAFFAAMKDVAVFVNVSRGAVVDEPALLASLQTGKPAHAVLDVFEQEPLPPEHPFWSHPRVVVTAHTSPAGDGQQARNDALFLENLRRYMAGEQLLNLADPADVLDS
ncbi:MAG TPA: D-2-hydroxyacid dehydrogenase [Sinorhizobium sp.]|nr:D-2-hydroxyacid dehydrogenase [Sinorhizobium sp.]